MTRTAAHWSCRTRWSSMSARSTSPDLEIFMEQLRAEIRRDQLASFVRLKGGFPFPLAGAVYWAALGVAGYSLSVNQWNLAAFVFSGAIFPLAMLLSKIFRSDFMKDKTATGDVLGPAFTG